MTDEKYRCPGCNQMSTMVISPTQALCTNYGAGCVILTFNPSLPDGGLSKAVVISTAENPKDVALRMHDSPESVAVTIADPGKGFT